MNIVIFQFAMLVYQRVSTLFCLHVPAADYRLLLIFESPCRPHVDSSFKGCDLQGPSILCGQSIQKETVIDDVPDEFS